MLTDAGPVRLTALAGEGRVARMPRVLHMRSDHTVHWVDKELKWAAEAGER